MSEQQLCISCGSKIVVARTGSEWCSDCRPCAVCSKSPARQTSRDPRWPGHWCGACVISWRRHGEPGKVIQPKGLPLAERFAQYVGAPDPETGCMEWLGGSRSKGYGAFRLDAVRRGVSAARVALELDGRPAPPGAHSLHSCDNPPCVNPAHLRWGTNTDNVNDKVERGRTTARLSDADVARIRSLAGSLTQRELAVIYGVSPSYVGMILNGTRRSL